MNRSLAKHRRHEPRGAGPRATPTAKARTSRGGGRRWLVRARRWAIGLLLAVAALWLGRDWLLTRVGDFLVVRDPLTHADLIYIHGGEPDTRVVLAAQLYRGGYAPRILLTRVKDTPATVTEIFPNESDATVRLLGRFGVPRGAVLELRMGEGVTSTTEEAAQLARYLRAHPARRVIAVTTWYHTRRARWALRRALRGMPVQIEMAGAGRPDIAPNNWWRSERGLVLVFEEYLKSVHNRVYR